MRRRRDPTERLRAVQASVSSAELTVSLDDSSPEVARAAVARLVELEGPRAAEPLRDRLLSSDQALVGDIARALRRVDDPTVVDVAMLGLRAERYPQRLAAARALRALADARAADALRSALRDPIAGVRAAVLAALAELGPNEHTAIECSVMLSDPDAQVRLAATRAVVRTARHPGRFLAAAAHDSDRRVRLELGRHLAALPADATRSLLSDRDLRVREAAARGAGIDQVGALAAMLAADPSRDVRCAAAQTLRELADRHTADVLLPGLEDRDAVVRAAVVRALATSLGTAGAVTLLRSQLTASSAHRRRATIYGLGHLNTKDAAQDIARLVDDPDPDVRLAVIHTASVLHSAPELLVRYMASDLDPAVRHSAEIWLQRRE